jgi:hypothetical protein
MGKKADEPSGEISMGRIAPTGAMFLTGSEGIKRPIL